MTLFFRTNENKEVMDYARAHEHMKFKITVDGIGVSDKACALRVRDAVCIEDNTFHRALIKYHM